MSGPLEVVVFDVNETLSDLTPLATRFTDVGAPAALAPLLVRVWFASVLREGFALAVTGEQAGFADHARSCSPTCSTPPGSPPTPPKPPAT